jgi:error-prone DNA polymerase
LLGISGVDPIRHNLLFERFLSPLREALPDIDVDVESARRTDIYTRIFERYGKDRVACVSMADTYRVRHAIRDVGAALGLPPGEIDTVAKAFPHIRARDAQNALRELPELRASRLGDDPRLKLLFSLVERLDGLPRHLALHPCGVLLSDISLLSRTPVEPSAMGFAMSQFDKDDVEHLGLLKLDVLGIRMQSAMAHALDEIERVDGLEQRPDLTPSAAFRLSHPANESLLANSHLRPSTTSSSTSRCFDQVRSSPTWSILFFVPGRDGRCRSICTPTSSRYCVLPSASLSSTNKSSTSFM